MRERLVLYDFVDITCITYIEPSGRQAHFACAVFFVKVDLFESVTGLTIGQRNEAVLLKAGFMGREECLVFCNSLDDIGSGSGFDVNQSSV